MNAPPPSGPPPTAPTAPLARVIGLPGAILLGLGSIVGTGVFVSLGLAAGLAGTALPVAVAFGALLALANGLSSAQLAAAFPQSGGTYEYAHRTLNHGFALVAGWSFLVAKSASAATAALGLAGYLLDAVAVTPDRLPRTALAVAAVAALTAVVAGGIRRSSHANAAIVAVTLAGLLALVAAAAPAALAHPDRFLPRLRGAGAPNAADLLHATALMFVAYTGYGRIATLGEEVRDPRETIPRAIAVTLGVALFIYMSVAVTGAAAIGADGLAHATRHGGAPLDAVARASSVPAVRWIIGAAAVTAMLGVLLNLLLGLSRVVLAMARRRDLPPALATVDEARSSPRAAVALVGAVIAGLALLGSVRLTWTLSAFAVLLYYAITNLAALRLPAAERRYPRWIAGAGLAICTGLAGSVGVAELL